VRALAACSRPLLIASFLCLAASMGLTGLRLAWLLRAGGMDRLPTGHVLAVHFTSLFYHLIAPGTLAGDVVRVAALTGRHTPPAALVPIALIWRVLGSVAMFGWAAVGSLRLWSRGLPAPTLLLAPALILAAGGLLALLLSRRLPDRLLARPCIARRALLTRWIREFRTAATLRQRPGLLGANLAAAGAVQFLLIGSWWLTARSLNIPVPWTGVLLVVPLTGILRMLPLSVEGIGIREAATLSVLSALQVEPAGLVAVPLLVSAQFLALALAGGITHLARDAAALLPPRRQSQVR
ncbi:MAG: flippase-like domain-containing protein, partial [Lentisphaerae bacterium]|nr:flippase-like domain-containing protein [Lentisphaerota bacterium]